jgi:hypothetical protein
MTRYLGQPDEVALRERAVENWHLSLELDPSQPRLKTLIEKYRVKAQTPALSFE